MSRGILAITLLLGIIIMDGCATFHAGAPKGTIDVIAHRGANAYAPENTLASFRMAMEMHADWFELDCHLSKDGQVIVIHDDDVERTTTGHGLVRDLTLAELKKLDAGTKTDPKFAGEALPTLAEALDLARGRIGVYIEIKDDDDDTELTNRIAADVAGHAKASPGLLRDMMSRIQDSGTRNLELTRKTIQLVRQRHMAHQVVLQSFSPIICAVVLAEAPDLRIELLGGKDSDEYRRWARLLPVAGLNLSGDSLSAERVAAIHKEGRTAAVWTVDKEDDMRRLAEWGVDGIISNRPDVCRRVLQDLGKR